MTAPPREVLVLQTARPDWVHRGMQNLLDKQALGAVRITVFCRALPEEVAQFKEFGWISELLQHDETHGVLGHLRELRKRKYDIVVAFFTRDPSYWKMKYFAFACGGRQFLIFNENLDCFFYSHRAFYRFLRARYRDWSIVTRQKLGYALGTPQGMMSEASKPGLAILRPLHLALKLMLFPLRWIYLLAWSARMQARRRRMLQQQGGGLKFEEDSQAESVIIPE